MTSTTKACTLHRVQANFLVTLFTASHLLSRMGTSPVHSYTQELLMDVTTELQSLRDHLNWLTAELCQGVRCPVQRTALEDSRQQIGKAIADFERLLLAVRTTA